MIGLFRSQPNNLIVLDQQYSTSFVLLGRIISCFDLFHLTIQITYFLSCFDWFLETEVQDWIQPETNTKKPDLPKLIDLKQK